MKKIDRIKEEVINEVFSQYEMENLMTSYGYSVVEVEDEETTSGIIKFTNGRSEVWIYGTNDEDNNILVENASVSTKSGGKTQVQPFKSYADAEKILSYFKTNGQYEYWLCAGLCMSLGRRVGDILSLKWSDLFYREGGYRERLTTLKEEKTGKIVAPVLNALAKYYIDKYLVIFNINPIEQYGNKIFSKGYESYRIALKNAATECELKYPIGTHSFRKFYANTLYQLHPQDAHSLEYIQFILGHSSQETTKVYIGEIDRQIDKYNKDYSEHILKLMNGDEVDIKNSPIVCIKAADFRELLGKCWELANYGIGKFETVNQIIGETEQKAI